MELKLNLVLQEPIIFNKIKIYQPTIQDIMDYGLEKFNSLLMPYVVDKNQLHLDDKQFEQVKMFDLFVYNGSPLQEFLLNSLSFFCKTDKIIINLEKQQIIVGEGFLDRNNFQEFCYIILTICAKEVNSDNEQAQKFSGKAKAIYEKIHKYRNKQKDKNSLYLWDMIKVVEMGGQSYIPISQIKEMTMWKLTDLYKTILNIQSYKDNFEVFLVSGDKNVIEQHWTDRIKLDNGGKN